MNKEIEEAIGRLHGLLVTTFNYSGYTETGVYWQRQIHFKEDHKYYADAIEIALNYIKELEEEKRITELTKISCCTAQNCGALENAIREGLENDKLRKQLADSTPNSVIREELEEAEKKYKKWRTHIGRLRYEGKIELCEKMLKEGEK